MRKKIKAFFHVFLNSFFPSDNYYKKIIKTRFLFSFKYFAVLIFILSGLFFSIFLVKNFIIKNSVLELKKNLIKSLDSYPEELVISIKNNRLTTNLDRPYIFWLKYNNIPHPLLAIDERAPKDKVYQYDSTTILINATGIVKRSNNQVHYYPFNIKNDLVISKQYVNNLKKLILNFFKFYQVFFPLILFLLFVFIFLFFFFKKIIYLLIISFFGFLLIKLFHIKTSYKKIFQISLHSNTLPLVCEFFILSLNWLAKSSFCYLFLTLVFFGAAIYEIYFHLNSLKTCSPHRNHKKHSQIKNYR